MAVQTTTINGASEQTIITAGTGSAASAPNNALVGLVITTAIATVGTLTFKDSTGGTTRMVIDYPNAAIAPGAPFIMMLPVGRELYQAAGGQNWTVTPSQAGIFHITAYYLEI